MASRDADPRVLERAIARLDEQLASKPDDPGLLDLRAKAAERLGRWDDAAGAWQALVRAARAAGDRPTEARACLQAGLALSRSEQPAKSVGFLQRAVSAFELLGDEPMTARARAEQARHHLRHGEDARARPLLERAAPALEAEGAWEQLGLVHRELSRIAAAASGPAAGLAGARKAVEAAGHANAGAVLGERLVHLASLHQACGEVAPAQDALQRALPHLRPLRGRARLLAAYQTLAELARAGGDPSCEERWLTEAVITADLAADLPTQGRCRAALAAALAARAPDRAATLLRTAIERFQRGGDPRGVATAWASLGRVLAHRDPAGARAAWGRAIEFLRMVGDDAGVTEITALAATTDP